MRINISKVLCVLFVVLLALTFVSCGNSEVTGIPNKQQPNHPESVIVSDIDMELVTRGGIYQMQAVADGGCYEIYGHIDGHGKLFFYDFDTRVISYVSNQLIPTDDETNPGWISDLMGGITPVVADDSLYLFKLGALPVPAESHPGYEKHIIKMDFDGTNRKTISLSSWQEFNTGAIAFDGNYLYFVVNEYDSNTGFLKQYYLCRANFDSMQLEIVCELGAEDRYSLVDVYEDGLVFQRFSVVGTTTDEYNMEVPMLKSEIVLYSIVENKFKDTDIIWSNNSISCVFGSNSKIYFVEPKTPKLYAYDLATGTRSLLCEDLNVDSLAIDSIYITGGIFDNHVPFCISTIIEGKDGEVSRDIHYFYDIETGKVNTVSFAEIDGLEMTAMYIVGESENEFFLHLGGRYVRTTKTSQNGDSYTFDELIYDYAMIDKEDYWNSVPNFAFFEDHVHAQ
ncbi:MAG: hypothetical protein RR058_02555 [Oscillospiraceae bacterium]